MTIQTLPTVVSRVLRAAAYSMLTVLLMMSASCMDEGAAAPEEVHARDGEDEQASAPVGESASIEKSLDGTCIGLQADGRGPLGGPNSVKGRCYNRRGQLVDSVAWLPGCVGNNDGQMVWGGLYFDRSCTDCVLEFAIPHDYRLACSCRRSNGSWARDTLQVSEYLFNRDGVLSCY